MEFLSELSAPSVAVASAATAAAAAYLNAKLAISTDLAAIRNDRATAARLGQRVAQLGDTATIYKMLERVVEVDGYGSREALWFEQKTWTYTQLKERKSTDALLSPPWWNLLANVSVSSRGSIRCTLTLSRCEVRRLHWRFHDQFP